MKLIGEPDAGKPHVRFDEGVQVTCDIAARLHPTLPQPPRGMGQRPMTERRPRLAFHATAATGLRCLLIRMSGPRYAGFPYPSGLPLLSSSS